LGLLRVGVGLTPSALSAFFIAAFVNYCLSITILFRHKAKWSTLPEVFIYLSVVVVVGLIDLYCTRFLVAIGFGPALAKILATGIVFVLNFVGRRFIVFPEKPNPDWKPQVRD
jgi:dolichol-phosphate mannosyltransferase